MPHRSYASTANYRFGFNGKENDNEPKGLGNEQDYGMRIYDPRLGRFLSLDPLSPKYPSLTPFQFASNTPIQAFDLDGMEAANFNGAKLKRAEYVDTKLGLMFDILANGKEFSANVGVAGYNQVVDATELGVNLFSEAGRTKISKQVLDPAVSMLLS